MEDSEITTVDAPAYVDRTRNEFAAEHFESLDQQIQASRLGMWLFLGTEVLLFAGLFVAYAAYRHTYPQTFADASRHLDVSLGTINTLALITSSFLVAMALHASRKQKRLQTTLYLVGTLLLAGLFLVIKGFEYAHKFHEGALPGKFYHFEAVQGPGVNLFFTIYFLATGLHGIHVLVGMGILTWLTVRAARGYFLRAPDTSLELGALYWHLVDVIWIFLFPLLYLI